MVTLICPECQADLINWSILAHARSHWPDHLDDIPDHREARRRQAILLAWAEEQRRAAALTAAGDAPPQGGD